MTETHDQRLARLTELAQRVWPAIDDADFICSEGGVDVLLISQKSEMVMAEINAVARPLDALEAALGLLAGEAPQWAVALAEKWRLTRASMEGTGQADALNVCADELLEAVKGGAR